MQYGICNLNTIALRAEPYDTSEMVSQVLYGEHFKVLEVRKKWSRIRISFDNYQGWIDNKQYVFLTEGAYYKLETTPLQIAAEYIEFVNNKKQELTPISLGASVSSCGLLGEVYLGKVMREKQNKQAILHTAHMYLNTPYLWGGKTPFGIDCSGFTQMVYKINGYALKRDAYQQASQGEALSFIEESEPGDLAFFDNEEGHITHVGIILKDNHIIHAHGKVRIDRLDHTGIFNIDSKRHTHKLRVIKKII